MAEGCRGPTPGLARYRVGVSSKLGRLALSTDYVGKIANSIFVAKKVIRISCIS